MFTIDEVGANVPFAVRWRFASSGTSSGGWLLDEVAGVDFTTSFKSGKPPEPGAPVNSVSLSPNPLRGAGQLSYTLIRDCKVSINLYDASGRLVRPLATDGFKEGVNTTRLDASRLASGVYFVKLAADGATKTTKVIIE